MSKKQIRYPWDKWFAKRKFTITRGKEFTCMPHSMSVQVRTAAAKRGISVSVEIDEDVLSVAKK